MEKPSGLAEEDEKTFIILCQKYKKLTDGYRNLLHCFLQNLEEEKE